VAGTDPLLRHTPQLAGGVVARVAVSGGDFRLGVQQESPILSDKEEEQTVDEPEELAVIVLGIELSRTELLSQLVVGPVGEEAGA
jgi:hypothetical protein